MRQLMSICMQKLARAMPLAAVALGVLAGSGFFAPATTYGDIEITLDDWAMNGPVVVGDNRFTFVSKSAGLLGGYKMSIAQIGPDYNATLSLGPNNPINSWNLVYTVDIIPPFYEFDEVALASTVNPSITTLEKLSTNYTPDVGLPFNLTSINGSTVGKNGLAGISLKLDSTYTRGGGSGTITSATWSFTQTPEPGQLTLLGVGALGFGFATYRRRKQAKRFATRPS